MIMMKDMGPDEEFAEFDVTEDQIDAMMAAGQPVEVGVPGDGHTYIETLYVVVGPPVTLGGASVTPTLGGVGPSVTVAAPVDQHSEAAA
jgi:hypothetical protein